MGYIIEALHWEERIMSDKQEYAHLKGKGDNKPKGIIVK